MCNCIDEIRAKIKQIDPTGYIVETQTYMDRNAKVGSEIAFTERMCGHYNIRLKNKKDEYTNRRCENLISFEYCPFCGEKYK